MKKILFLISILALFNLMCGFISAYEIDKESFTKVEPKPNEFAGKYLPSKDTIAFIKDRGQFDLEDSWFELFTDGTFEMRNVPNWWIYKYSKSEGRLESGTGKWEFDPKGQHWEIHLEFDPGGTFSDQDHVENGFGTWAIIGSDQPPYTIWLYVGDPDYGDVMIYEQVIETP